MGRMMHMTIHGTQKEYRKARNYEVSISFSSAVVTKVDSVRRVFMILKWKYIRKNSLHSSVLKSVAGDAVKVLLATAAFNFKRMMNRWRRLASLFAPWLFRLVLPDGVRLNAYAA